MILKTVEVGFALANCYLIGCQRALKGAIIDPGAEGEKILKLIESMDLKIDYIINTHGHVDHIGANSYLKDRLGAEICIHEEDEKLLQDPYLNLSSFLFQSSLLSPPPDRILHEGEQINIGDITLLIIHTPGHTAGSISVIADKAVFTGDALFQGSIGRTDIPLGNHNTLLHSIRSKLLTLPDEYTVYPGHGPSSTVGKEKRENPFL